MDDGADGLDGWHDAGTDPLDTLYPREGSPGGLRGSSMAIDWMTGADLFRGMPIAGGPGSGNVGGRTDAGKISVEAWDRLATSIGEVSRIDNTSVSTHWPGVWFSSLGKPFRGFGDAIPGDLSSLPSAENYKMLISKTIRSQSCIERGCRLLGSGLESVSSSREETSQTRKGIDVDS